MAIPTRKIISISVVSWDAVPSSSSIIYALCDDGTLWRSLLPSPGAETMWEMVEPIPQTKVGVF